MLISRIRSVDCMTLTFVACPCCFNSSPAYFEPDSEAVPPRGGDAVELCQAFGVPSAAEMAEAILRENLLEDGASLSDELERHRALATVLCMPENAIGVGFEAIEHGYLPEGLLATAFERVERD